MVNPWVVPCRPCQFDCWNGWKFPYPSQIPLILSIKWRGRVIVTSQSPYSDGRDPDFLIPPPRQFLYHGGKGFRVPFGVVRCPTGRTPNPVPSLPPCHLDLPFVFLTSCSLFLYFLVILVSTNLISFGSSWRRDPELTSFLLSSVNNSQER